MLINTPSKKSLTEVVTKNGRNVNFQCQEQSVPQPAKFSHIKWQKLAVIEKILATEKERVEMAIRVAYEYSQRLTSLQDVFLAQACEPYETSI